MFKSIINQKIEQLLVQKRFGSNKHAEFYNSDIKDFRIIKGLGV